MERWQYNGVPPGIVDISGQLAVPQDTQSSGKMDAEKESNLTLMLFKRHSKGTQSWLSSKWKHLEGVEGGDEYDQNIVSFIHYTKKTNKDGEKAESQHTFSVFPKDPPV